MTMFLIDRKHGERKACDGCRQTGAQCAHCLARVPGAAEPRPGYFVLCDACERLRLRRGSLYIPPERVKRAI